MEKRPIDILLIDDDQDICIMIEAVMSFSGYEVKYCHVADRVHQFMQNVNPRIILMDLYLSGSDGRDFCKMFRENPETANTAIIMMSAHPDAKQACLEAGANDFLAKPFDIDRLLSLVNIRLRRSLN